MVDRRRPALREYLTLLERVPETFDSAWDAIAVYDLEGRLTTANPAAHALVGDDFAVALRGGHFTEHLTLDVARRSAHSFAACATTGRTIEIDSIVRDANGASVPVRVRLVPARHDGAIVGVIAFARDMRAVRAAESQFMRAEQQFRALFESHPDALSMHDLDGRYLRINAALTRLCGYDADELIGETPDKLGTESAAERRDLLAAVKRGETVVLERAIRVKDGTMIDVCVLAVPLVIDEEVRGYCAIVSNITEQRRRERDAERAAKRIGDLYQIAATSTMSADDKVTSALERARVELDGSWAYVGRFHDGRTEITHVSGDPEVGFPVGHSLPIERTISGRVRDADGPVVVNDLPNSSSRAVLDGRRARWRSYIGVPLIVNGERYGVVGVLSTARTSQLSASDGDYVRAIGALIASAVQQGAREKRLDTLAFHDALTGLPNRALFADRLERALVAARRNRRSFAVHYVDIDRFKEVNDTYGHHTGDAVLVAVADWLLSNLRESDTVARIGGDEFVVLQPEIESAQQAEDVAARLVRIRDAPLHVGEHTIAIRLSVGVAVYPADGSNTVDMLRAADTQLYGVKNRGRDGYAIDTV